MATHKCNKEAEIATMAEKINNIEKKIDTIDSKLDKVIETKADKHELESLRLEVKGNTNKIWKLTKDVAQLITVVAIITKLLNLW